MTRDPIPLSNLAALEAVAQKLAAHVRKNDLLALAGPLGVGKTTFARTLLRILGIDEQVPSPTFTLLQTYETKQFWVYHFDLYRLENENELDELGWDDAMAGGLVVVEWPERASKRLPRDRLDLHFSFDEQNRHWLEFRPQGNWLQRLKDIG